MRAKLRLVFHYGLFGWTPPPEIEGEFYVEPEGWKVAEMKRNKFLKLNNAERSEYILNKNRYAANKGIVLS